MKSVTPVTVLINARNNESIIADCLHSARLLTDEIVLVDQESTDRTVVIAREHGARVFPHECTRYVEPARMFGIRQVRTPWVFILDTDEQITLELAEEIKGLITETKVTHFRVPRKNIFCQTTWLRHGGWWPDHQTRLIRVDALRDWPARIHATPVIEGKSARLCQAMEHFFHSDISQMVRKTIDFEDIESDLLVKAGRGATVRTFFRKFIGELSRRLIVKQGFRDGYYGWLESIYQAYSKTITWLYVYEKRYIHNTNKT